MGNRKIRLPINPQDLLNWMKENGYSIRKLALLLDRDESTIRWYLKTGAMPPEVKDKLYEFLTHKKTLEHVLDKETERANARLQELKTQYLTARYAYLNYKRRLENHEV